jgi:hypothetical protein
MLQIEDTHLEGLGRIYELKQNFQRVFTVEDKSQVAATDTLITQQLHIRALDDLGHRWGSLSESDQQGNSRSKSIITVVGSVLYIFMYIFGCVTQLSVNAG